jgi:hypothetical protein
MSRYGVATMNTIYMKLNFYENLQMFLKNVAINTSFLSDEQFNELIKIQSTRIGKVFLKRVCKSNCQYEKMYLP